MDNFKELMRIASTLEGDDAKTMRNLIFKCQEQEIKVEVLQKEVRSMRALLASRTSRENIVDFSGGGDAA